MSEARRGRTSVDDDVALQQGLQYLAQHQPAKALESFDRALQLSPGDAAAWHGKAKAMLNMGEYQQAVAVCNQVLARYPSLMGALRTKLLALTELRRFEEALAVAETALEYDADSAYAWQIKGALLLELRRPAEALDALDHALALDTRQVSSWINKGIALLRLECPQEALLAFDQALALRPQDATAQRGRAQARAARNRAFVGAYVKSGIQLLIEAISSGLGGGH